LLVAVFQISKQLWQIQVVKAFGLGQLFDVRVIGKVVFQEDDSVDAQFEVAFVKHLVHHVHVGPLVVQAFLTDVFSDGEENSVSDLPVLYWAFVVE
jgi:hypothetical protein